jgi:6-phosphogluconolactonase
VAARDGDRGRHDPLSRRLRWRQRHLSRTLDVELTVFGTPEEASLAAAGLLAQAAPNGGAIALSGGSTPRASYELAPAMESDWSGVDVWLADERVVPLDDPRSNARLVQETLLAGLDRRPQTHFVRTDLAPEDAAAEYDQALRGTELTFALLGIGPDGHTASLFPHAPSLDEAERLAVAAQAGLEPFVPRVTLTLTALGTAAQVVFLVTGVEKAEAVSRAFAGEPSPATPASLVRSRRGTTSALLDAAAASALQ